MSWFLPRYRICAKCKKPILGEKVLCDSASYFYYFRRDWEYWHKECLLKEAG